MQVLMYHVFGLGAVKSTDLKARQVGATGRSPRATTGMSVSAFTNSCPRCAPLLRPAGH